MKLHRQWHNLFNFSQKNKINLSYWIVVRHGTLNTASGVSKWKPLLGIYNSHLLQKIAIQLFFLKPSFYLKSAFSKHWNNKTSTKTCL